MLPEHLDVIRDRCRPFRLGMACILRSFAWQANGILRRVMLLAHLDLFRYHWSAVYSDMFSFGISSALEDSAGVVMVSNQDLYHDRPDEAMGIYRQIVLVWIYIRAMVHYTSLDPHAQRLESGENCQLHAIF